MAKANPAAKPAPPDVQVGQVWRDNDSRFNVGRWLKVLSITGDYARCLSSYNKRSWEYARNVRIRLTRFRPNASGYILEGRDD